MTSPTAVRTDRRTARRTTSRLLVATLVWSTVCAGLGGWWVLDLGAYVLDAAGSEQPTSLPMVASPGMGAVAFLALGLAGIPLALALARVDRTSPGRPALLAVGAAYAVGFAVLVPDVQLLALLGYALALLGPPLLVVVLLAGVRRSPRNLAVLLAIAVVVTAGVLAGEVGGRTLEMLRQVAAGVARVGLRPLVLAVLVLGGVLFAALTFAAARRGLADDGRRLERWGRAATWVAAVCPLPYTLLRMTWLTPWPLGLPGGDELRDAGIRVFGVLLGLAALGGAWLTVGLVSRWGEVWPAWLPWLRGRPVPVLAAVVPATVVSVALCGSAVSLVTMSVLEGEYWVLAAIPAPVWGPALGLATYAYYRRRTAEAPGGPGRPPGVRTSWWQVQGRREADQGTSARATTSRRTARRRSWSASSSAADAV